MAENIQKEKNEGIEIFDNNLKTNKTSIKDIFDTFKMEELDTQQTRIITVVGKKHSGKTSITYGFTGSKYYLSYDRNSAKPLDTLLPRFSKNKDIKEARKDFHFFNGAKYYNNLSTATLRRMSDINEILRKWQEASVNTYYYTIFLLDELAKKETVDYLVIDGSEIVWKCCEQIMRVRHNLVASQGFKEGNWWKERNILWDVIHQKAMNIAKKGVIYTTYLKTFENDDDDTVKETRYKSKKEPNWYGSMMLETEIKLETFTEYEKDGEKHYFVNIESKIDSMPEAATLDITNRTIIDALKEYYSKHGKK